jgi:hypothetical protein
MHLSDTLATSVMLRLSQWSPFDLQAIERHHAQLCNAAADASQRAQATDTRAAWSAESITLQSLADYILRSRLPDEFAIESIELGSATSTTGSEPSLNTIYEWVFANFDINKPLHYIALITGIYVRWVYHSTPR